MQADLKTEIAGLELRNPTMLSAGVLGMTGKSLRAVWDAGAGAVVTKSLGLKPRQGYPNPSVVDVGCGLLNAMGLPNPGVQEFMRELKAARSGGTIKIIGSVYGGSADEFAETAQILSQEGVDAIELNVSCPHVKEVGVEIGQNPDLVEEVVSKVKKAVTLPLFVKLSPNVTSITNLALSAEKGGADAVVAINTIRAMAIDIETRRPVLGNKIGGLSGPAIKPVALRCVYEVSQAVKIPVVGCGGISNWRDAVEFLLAGATAVQVGTAVAYRDLCIFKEVTSGLERYLVRKGYRRVGEIVGLSH
jgi:dihydroorotate dehydrogenase (NAD+) catalytic subunit